MLRPLTILSLVAACGGAPVTTSTLSASEHRAEAAEHEDHATRHEADAQELERRPRSIHCGDAVPFDTLTSGGQRLVTRVPCWSVEVGATREHRRAAAHERAAAARHRAAAHALERTERERCATLPPDERDHTPFWHHSDVLAVEKLEERGALRGARVVFRRVPSLTREWLEQAVRCHQARAAVLGWQPTYMGYDPSLLPGARVSVTEEARGFAVDVDSGDPDVAAVIYGRARALMTPDPITTETPAR